MQQSMHKEGKFPNALFIVRNKSTSFMCTTLQMYMPLLMLIYMCVYSSAELCSVKTAFLQLEIQLTSKPIQTATSLSGSKCIQTVIIVLEVALQRSYKRMIVYNIYQYNI